MTVNENEEFKNEIVKDMKKSLGFMKISVITMFTISILFTITMIILFIVKDSVPDTLVSSFFTFIGIEGGSMAVIKSVESYSKKLADIKRMKINKNTNDIGEEIEKILESDDDSEYDET